MQIGLLKEVKDHEYRVALTPTNAEALVMQGHSVWVEQGAGVEVGFCDKDYERAGATLLAQASEVFSKAELIVKVKEPLPEECAELRPGQILFTFLHLAANPKIATLLLASGCIAFAYETVTNNAGGLPLLTPMSEIAGRLSVQAGAHYLEKTQGGKGILLGGLSGVEPAKVLILGVGNAGSQALQVAVGMGAHVTILNKSIKRLNELANIYNAKPNKVATSRTNINNAHPSLFIPIVQTDLATQKNVARQVANSDLVIGTVLSPGAMTPKIVTRSMIQSMKPGSVVVDVSIDQGGCFETSHPTTHSNPTYVEEGVVHYCVTNMPGVVPLTSTLALTNATLPFVMQLANLGCKKACQENPHLKQGLNIFKGKLTHPIVAEALNMNYTSPDLAMKVI